MGGQEALHSARVALKSILTMLQAALSDLQQDIASAEKSCSDFPEPPPTEIEALKDLTEFKEIRDQTPAMVLDAHKRHLTVLNQAVAARIALLKSKSSFKP